ncbi:MAG: hypothetical protein JEZ09_15670 [Salinivirgaceae bacterium]|nr:hypothetical protein [Salinivirgaceae bacterium]
MRTVSAITYKGCHRSQQVLNVLVLLNCDEGEHQEKKSLNEEISTIIQICAFIAIIQYDKSSKNGLHCN